LFGPASAFAGDVLAEVDRHGPDAVAADCFLFGALAAAERSGLPSAALWHTVYARSDWDTPADGMGLPLARAWPGKLRDRAFKMVEARLWNKGLPALNAARAGLGLDPLDTVFEQWDRADRILVMTSSAFDFACLAGTALPENVRYVGPQVEIGSLDRTSRAAWSDRPLVLVSFSTSYQAQEPLLRRVVAALGALPVRVLVTTGRAVELTGSLPSNVEVRRWVPHAEVLPDAALVVTHAGMGTAMAALAHGVPLVCLPMGRDQLDVAARVVHAGAGLRLSPKTGERRIAAAVREALARPELGQNAERLGRAIRDEIAADRGVAELVRLAGARASPRTASPSRAQ
jgi:MGT family glycosyltransferase